MSKSKLRKTFNQALVSRILDNINFSEIKNSRKDVQNKLLNLKKSELLKIKGTYNSFELRMNGVLFKEEFGYHNLKDYIDITPSDSCFSNMMNWVFDTNWYYNPKQPPPPTPGESKGFLPKQPKNQSPNVSIHHRYKNKS